MPSDLHTALRFCPALTSVPGTLYAPCLGYRSLAFWIHLAALTKINLILETFTTCMHKLTSLKDSLSNSVSSPLVGAGGTCKRECLCVHIPVYDMHACLC